MNFNIEPWEIPPGANADNLSVPIEFGPVDWHGTPTMISARTLEIPTTRNFTQNLIFIHPQGSKVNFIPLVQDSMYLENIWSVHISELENIVVKHIKNLPNRFGRAFYIEEQLCVISQSKFFWSRRDLFFDLSFSAPENLCKETSSQVFQWISQQWENPDSEVRYASEWGRKTESERRQYLKENVPQWQELMNLMRAVVCVEDLPKDAPWSLNGPIYRTKYSAEALARSQVWRELLKDKFSPFEPFPESSPQCLNDYLEAFPKVIVVKGEDFSAHQQLEARLLLRAWLQTNAPQHLDLLQNEF